MPPLTQAISDLVETDSRTSPYASSEVYGDDQYAETIGLIRTFPGKLYNLDKDVVNPYEEWRDLISWFQNMSIMDIWDDPPQSDMIPADDQVMDFERYSLYLEEIIYQLMYDLSVTSRLALCTNSILTANMDDDFIDFLPGSGFSKVLAMHLFDFNNPVEPFKDSISSSSYEIDRLISLFSGLSPAQQGVLQNYLDWALPKAYPANEK